MTVVMMKVMTLLMNFMILAVGMRRTFLCTALSLKFTEKGGTIGPWMTGGGGGGGVIRGGGGGGLIVGYLLARRMIALSSH